MKYFSSASRLAMGMAVFGVCTMSVQAQEGTNSSGSQGDIIGNNRCIFFDKIHFTANVRSGGTGGTNGLAPITPTDFDVKVLDKFDEVADLSAKVIARLDEICGTSTGTGSGSNAGSGTATASSSQCPDIDRSTIQIKNVALAVHCVDNVTSGTSGTGSPGAGTSGTESPSSGSSGTGTSGTESPSSGSSGTGTSGTESPSGGSSDTGTAGTESPSGGNSGTGTSTSGT